MKQKLIITRAATTLCGLLAAIALTHHAVAENSKPIDLGTLPGGTWSMAWYVNNAGDVVGLGDVQGNMRPWFMATKGPRARQMVDLGTLGGEFPSSNPFDTQVMAMAVNNQGLVVGHAFTADGVLHGFAWTQKRGMVDLGTLPDKPGTWSVAMGVNDCGIIVGWAGASGWWWLDTVAVAWIPVGNGWRIAKLTDQSNTSAFSINNAGQIVGGFDAFGQPKPQLWEPLPQGKGWQVVTLDTPTDYPFGYTAYNNEAGLAAGWVVPDGNSTFGNSVPALWDPAAQRGPRSRVTMLATLADPPNGLNWVDGINEVGDLVGLSTDANGAPQAVHWLVGEE